jgi:acyl-CoA synthetase (AMP-forming)/AMP-acid ligase II/thioesterase domain-containing protein/acyl carrier protein
MSMSKFMPAPHLEDIAPANVSQILRRAAREHPDSGLRYCASGAQAESRFLRYPDLLAAALRVAEGLLRRGLHRGDRALLLLERQDEFLTAFWGCLLSGVVPCPTVAVTGDRERWAAQLAYVDALLQRPLLITSEALAAELPEVPGLQVAELATLCEHPSAPRNAVAEEAMSLDAAPDDLALLVLTSGSTGSPKAVMLTHANLLASMSAKNAVHRLTDSDTTLNWVSFDHVAALLECHLLPMFAGATQLHVEAPVVLEEPIEFLRLISRHRVTMTFTPNFLLGQLNSAPSLGQSAGEKPKEELDLTCVRQIISGGEALVCATGEAFLERFARYGLKPSTLWPAFGMTETCAGSTYSTEFPEVKVEEGQEFASVGRPVDLLRLRVVDTNDSAQAEGVVGELQLIGPMVTPGYYNNEDANRAAFTADGWFRTGDLGRVNAGRLTLVGRTKDSIIVNGVNYFSHEIETLLEQLDGVAPSYVAAFPTRAEGEDTERLVIAVHPDPPMDDAGTFRLLTAIRSSVVMHWGFRPALILPLPADAFPKTSLGKIQRTLLRRRLEDGDFDDVTRQVTDLTMRQLGGYSPPLGDIECALAEVYAEMFGVSPATISATASFFDLGGTSLDILRLRGRVAQRLGVDLEIITVLTAPTVRALAAALTADAAGPRPYDPIVPMQTSGAKTPLFCVHPGVGEVLVFVNLAKYFVGERPFYALRARGFNDGEQPFGTFEEMVTTYVAAIRARQPHGPYALAGYSYGGAVAFEIAKALEADGQRVDFCGSFNLPPHIKYRMNELDFVETATNLAFFLELIDKKQSAELPARLRDLPREEQLQFFIDSAPHRRLAELDLDLAKFTAWAELAHGLTSLARDYEPRGRTRSMTVFYAIPLRGTKEEWLANELRRWDEHSLEPNRYVEVPGAHYTLMGPQHVAAFQAILRRELDHATGEH